LLKPFTGIEKGINPEEEIGEKSQFTAVRVEPPVEVEVTPGGHEWRNANQKRGDKTRGVQKKKRHLNHECRGGDKPERRSGGRRGVNGLRRTCGFKRKNSRKLRKVRKKGGTKKCKQGEKPNPSEAKRRSKIFDSTEKKTPWSCWGGGDLGESRGFPKKNRDQVQTTNRAEVIFQKKSKF